MFSRPNSPTSLSVVTLAIVMVRLGVADDSGFATDFWFVANGVPMSSFALVKNLFSLVVERSLVPRIDFVVASNLVPTANFFVASDFFSRLV